MHFDLCWSIYIDLFEKGIICHDHDWQKSNWSKLLQRKWKLTLCHFLVYITKKIIVRTKRQTWKGCVEVIIKLSVSLFLFAHPWRVNRGTAGICFAQRQESFSDSTYCSLVFLFYSLLCSSPSTSSGPSLSFRSLAAWYQLWVILLCKIHSDLGSYEPWSSYFFLFTWERINTCIVL